MFIVTVYAKIIQPAVLLTRRTQIFFGYTYEIFRFVAQLTFWLILRLILFDESRYDCIHFSRIVPFIYYHITFLFIYTFYWNHLWSFSFQENKFQLRSFSPNPSFPQIHHFLDPSNPDSLGKYKFIFFIFHFHFTFINKKNPPPPQKKR